MRYSWGALERKEPGDYRLCHIERFPREASDAADNATPYQPAALEYLTVDGDGHAHEQKDDSEGLDLQTEKDL